jgi:hypothetical protein
MPKPPASSVKIPFMFQPNLGQADERVQFLSRGRGYDLFLKQTEVLLCLRDLKMTGQNSAILPS